MHIKSYIEAINKSSLFILLIKKSFKIYKKLNKINKNRLFFFNNELFQKETQQETFKFDTLHSLYRESMNKPKDRIRSSSVLL